MKTIFQIWVTIILGIAFPLKNFAFSGIDTGRRVVHIYFNFNSLDVDPVGIDQIKALTTSLNQSDSAFAISCEGYCDNIGSNTANDQISMLRANVVKKRLIESGIDSGLIGKISGFGKRKPLNSNKTGEERRANRRVDINVILTRNIKLYNLSQFNKDLVKRGSHIILRNIHFSPGTHQVLIESEPILDSLVKIMISNPTLKISIQGHLCCTYESDAYDLATSTYALSKNRGKEVYDYLVNHNISPSRLEYVGFGGRHHLINPEVTEADKMLNRRVEIVVTSW